MLNFSSQQLLNTRTFVVAQRPLADWVAMLHEWTRLVQQSYDDTDGVYTPYSYKEQTNVGVLASAAAKAGWVGMVECAFIKNSDKKGRADLLLLGERERYFVEAKLTGDVLPKLKRKVMDRLGKARRNVSEMPCEPGAHRVALTFVVPRFHKCIALAEIESGVDEIISHCREQCADAFASVFPGRSPLPLHDGNDKEKYTYGVILLAAAIPESTAGQV